MSDPIDGITPVRDQDDAVDGGDNEKGAKPRGVPSNEVYARVGDKILRAAQDGVRRGLPPEDIIREIVREHNVHLRIGELRLLLASRRVPE